MSEQKRPLNRESKKPRAASRPANPRNTAQEVTAFKDGNAGTEPIPDGQPAQADRDLAFELVEQEYSARLAQLQAQIAHLNPEDQESLLVPFRAEYNASIEKLTNADPGELEAIRQQLLPGLAHMQGLQQNGGFHGQNQGESSESDENRQHTQNASHFLNQAQVNSEGLFGLSPGDQLMQQQNQATALLMQQMGLGIAQNTEKQWACYLQQQKMQMGNQLRLFALEMFKTMTKNQKKNLEKKAKSYLENCMKDQKRLQNLKVPGSTADQTSLAFGEQSFLDSPVDFEFQADPKKYIDEVKRSLSKNQQVSDNFQRFIQMMFEDTEQEQVYTNFITQNPRVHQYYMGLAIQYNHFNEQGDHERQAAIGNEIFNLIMPHAQQVDSRLLHWIPKEVLEQFEIRYESDGFHIKDWRQLDEHDDSTSGQDNGQGEDANSSSQNRYHHRGAAREGAGGSSSSRYGNGNGRASGIGESSSPSSHSRTSQDENSHQRIQLTSNTESIGSDHNLNNLNNLKSKRDSAGSRGITNNNGEVQEESDSSDSQHHEAYLMDGTGNHGGSDGKRPGPAVSKPHNDFNSSPSLTKKHKSFMNSFNQQHANKKFINRHELKTVDNFCKSVKDDKDWLAFCRLFYGYFEGIYSLTDFFKLYDEKFYAKVKQEVREEVVKLLQTRDQSRRSLSNLLKPWNDHENQTFEKIPDSSYFKIDDDFPIPTCSRKMMEEIYHKNINDRYLSLAIGTENFKFKFRNLNEENVYKAEDNLYVCETQIDNIRRSYKIVNQILKEFNALSEVEQATYKFPTHRLNPLRFYWDRKLRLNINEQYFREGRIMKQKDILALKKALHDRLEFQKNQKNQQIKDIKEQFKKNFTKSLDHKSFQYRADFMKKFTNKQTQVQKIKQLQEENLVSRVVRKEVRDNRLSILYGSGEIPDKSFYKFFNTFGKDFGKFFDDSRLKQLEKSPDHPIDMNFLEKVSEEALHRNQAKCPQARFIMNDKRIFEIVVKLVIQNITIQGSNNHQSTNQTKKDKQEVVDALKFILTKFLMVPNFDEIEEQSDNLQPLTPELVEILMNSAQYYQMKYDGALEPMCELFPIDGLSLTNQPSLAQSPVQSPLQKIQYNNSQQNQDDSNKQLFNQDNLEENSSHAFSHAKIYEQEQANSNSNDFEGYRALSNQLSAPHQRESQADLSMTDNLKQVKPEQIKEEDAHKFKPLKLDDQPMLSTSAGSSRPKDELHLLEQAMDQNLFVPHFCKDAQPQQQYKLYYCPLNVYMFLMYFYSIYERILKAQELVKAKVEQDFNDDFSKNEWSAKFQSKMQTLVDERFQYLVKAVLTTMSHTSIMDNNKYEDMARELLGNEAYLLFQVDKLVGHCAKQLNHFLTDHSCQVSQKLFQEFEDLPVKQESSYLVNFYEAANECSINNAHHQQGGKHAPGGSNITGAAAAHKDNQNPPMNQQAFRLMYSPKSCIMTAHFIAFNPFNLAEVKVKHSGLNHSTSNFPSPNGGVNEQEYLKFLKSYTIQRQREFYSYDEHHTKFESTENADADALQNKASSCCQPVFLGRNLRKMKQIRKSVFNERVQQNNGMVTRMIPLSQQLYFEVDTSDVMVYKRGMKPKTKEAAASKGKDSKGKKSVLSKRTAGAMQASQESSYVDRMKAIKQQDLIKQVKYRTIMTRKFKALQEGLVGTVPSNLLEQPAQNPEEPAAIAQVPADQDQAGDDNKASAHAVNATSAPSIPGPPKPDQPDGIQQPEIAEYQPPVGKQAKTHASKS